MDKIFPYTSVFESNVSYGGLFAESPFYSQASIEGLKPLIPDYQVDLSRNIDLLAFAANACSAGTVNKNDDMLEPEAAIETISLWRNKMVNLEHDRKKIVGHLLNSSFSSQNDSVIISAQEALASKEPFNVCVGGVIYRVADRDLAIALEQSADSESPFYRKLSLSFEVAFPKYSLAIGSDNFFEAEIVRNEMHVAELKKNLRAYGGSGKTKDGLSIYRLIEKDHLPLAVAVTRKPAAKMPLGTVVYSIGDAKPSLAEPVSSANISNNSQQNSVTPIKHPKNMEKYEQILEEIKASLLGKKVTEEALASVKTSLDESIREANDKYLTKINEASAAREKAEKELAEVKASLEILSKEAAETKANLQKIEAENQAKASAEKFSARMDEFNKEFDLDADDLKILADDLKNIDTDEAFAAFKDKMGKLMKDKSKKAKEDKAKEAKASLDKLVEDKLKEMASASTKTNLSEKELAEKALEQAKASKSSVIPNNNANSGEENLRDKFAAAFAPENITIKY